MSTERGIWSDSVGGFIETGCYSGDEQGAIDYFVDIGGEDRDDLTILEICEQHEEQPADGCEDCEEEEEDNEDE